MNKALIIFTLFLLVTGFLTGCSSADVGVDAEFGSMTQREAYELLNNGSDVILLDVRSEEEFLGGHVEGSVLLPLPELGEFAESVLQDKSATILVICNSGNRSQTASQELANLGYTNVYDIGGVLTWPGVLVQ